MNTVTLSHATGIALCNWHSSMSDPIYAVGSSAIAGHPVTTELLGQALANLEECYKDVEMNPGRYSLEDVLELENLIHALRETLDDEYDNSYDWALLQDARELADLYQEPDFDEW